MADLAATTLGIDKRSNNDAVHDKKTVEGRKDVEVFCFREAPRNGTGTISLSITAMLAPGKGQRQSVNEEGKVGVGGRRREGLRGESREGGRAARASARDAQGHIDYVDPWSEIWSIGKWI